MEEDNGNYPSLDRDQAAYKQRLEDMAKQPQPPSQKCRDCRWFLSREGKCSQKLAPSNCLIHRENSTSRRTRFHL